MKITDDVMYCKAVVAIIKLEDIKSKVKQFRCQDKLDVLYKMVDEYNFTNEKGLYPFSGELEYLNNCLYFKQLKTN